ncbi:restriction endonuclease subunit S [Acetomicrobium hydrogeniformans]|uniref:Type I restriction modification DNA specificity domain protein n=1 Tax=Acetomicrobium hydrogeniformans ATCC BAA-1850 TaxID=592015 RepID=A0A0T5XAM7_9BACT|nr:restriction endonuclease subunit S [Acetomicrobium hydrogeniformans]KRT35386.1 hypothetical protein HMPREF1705_02612 [Acetomicrobium hydrogeniformans ATCC BAA-1850]
MITNLKPYPAYKDSGVPWLGHVPEHWEVRRGKTLFRCIDVRSQTGQEELLTVSSERGVVPRRSANVTMFKAESYVGYKLCWPDDLVINSLWAWARGLGVSPYHGIVSSAYGVYRLRNRQQDNPRFIHQLVRSTPFQWELLVRSKGIWVSRLQLTDDAFLGASFPMPPSNEQTAIVRFLDYIDRRIWRYIRAKQKLIKLLEEYKQALIHQAVTGQIDVRTGKPYPAYKDSGVEWLGEVPEHWEIRRLGSSVRGCVNGVWGSEPNGKDDLPCVRVADFDRSRLRVHLDKPTMRAISSSDRVRRLLEPGDLLLEKSGGGDLQPVGRVVLYDHPTVAVTSNFIARMPVENGYDSIYLTYLHAALYSIELNVRSIKQTTGIQNLDSRTYLSELVAFPPLPEQTAIVEYLDTQTAKIDAAISAARSEIDLLREYRTRLIADVVTGKVDVREVAARLPEEPPEEEAESMDADVMAKDETTDEEVGTETVEEEEVEP